MNIKHSCIAIYFDRGFVRFLYEFLIFEKAPTSKIFTEVLGGQSILKVQNSYKSLYKNCMKPRSKIICIGIYLYILATSSLLPDCLSLWLISAEINQGRKLIKGRNYSRAEIIDF